MIQDDDSASANHNVVFCGYVVGTSASETDEKLIISSLPLSLLLSSIMSITKIHARQVMAFFLITLTII